MKWLPEENELEKLGIVTIPLEEISAQYNPHRFELWHKVCDYKEPLDMWRSPHVDLLRLPGSRIRDSHEIRFSRYVYLLRLYGRDNTWIYNKIHGFFHMHRVIEAEGRPRRKPIVLETPVVKNPYNSGYEIYEGHHRIACCIELGIQPEIDLRRARDF